MTSYNATIVDEEESESSEDETRVTREMMTTGEGVDMECKDLETSVWGITTLSIIRLSALKCTPALIVKVGYAAFISLLNYWLQFTTLYYVNRYIVGDAVHGTQVNYAQYHAEVFNPDKSFNETEWKTWTGPYMELCNLSMSKASFTVVILFMWSTRILTEFRDIHTLMSDVLAVIPLPRGASSSDMMQSADTDDGQQFNVVSMTCCCRFWIFTLVVVPKAIIAVILIYIGSRWLVATESFSDLILNALALEFIIGTDELVYDGFSPSLLKKAVESTKLCKLNPSGEKTPDDEENFCQVVCAYGRSLVMVLACCFWTILYMNYFQQVIPSYPFDIAPNCGGWFSKRYDPLCPIGTKDPMTDCFPYGTALGDGS